MCGAVYTLISMEMDQLHKSLLSANVNASCLLWGRSLIRAGLDTILCVLQSKPLTYFGQKCRPLKSFFLFLMELFCSRACDAIELHLSSCNAHEFFVFFWEGSLECSCGSKGGNNVVIIFEEAPCPQAYHRTQRKANRH